MVKDPEETMTDAESAPQDMAGDSRYAALLQGLFEAILITDVQGRILDANVSAQELFQVRGDEILQRSVLDLISGF